MLAFNAKTIQKHAKAESGIGTCIQEGVSLYAKWSSLYSDLYWYDWQRSRWTLCVRQIADSLYATWLVS